MRIIIPYSLLSYYIAVTMLIVIVHILRLEHLNTISLVTKKSKKELLKK